MTAEEVVREKQERLQTDPQYRAQVEAVEAERAERVRALCEAEAPVVADLRRAGVSVASVWDLVNTSEPYPDALPVLMEHLERGGYPDRVMESLGRALAVKPAVTYWERLKALYASPDRQGQQEGLVVALAASATKAQLDDLISFLGWFERGSARSTQRAGQHGPGP